VNYPTTSSEAIIKKREKIAKVIIEILKKNNI
jgi:hypothetical protein